MGKLETAFEVSRSGCSKVVQFLASKYKGLNNLNNLNRYFRESFLFFIKFCRKRVFRLFRLFKYRFLLGFKVLRLFRSCSEGVQEEKLNMSDNVNNPVHYNSHPSGVECIEITEHMNFCLGNAMKYIWRAALKGKGVEDLDKAIWYLTRERDRIAAKCDHCGNVLPSADVIAENDLVFCSERCVSDWRPF